MCFFEETKSIIFIYYIYFSNFAAIQFKTKKNDRKVKNTFCILGGLNKEYIKT